MGTRCVDCGHLFLPPRAICSNCHGEQMEWVELSGRGKLAAFTSVFIAPSGMAKAGYGRDNPYISGIVELEEGVRISARIEGLDARRPAEIQIGAPLTVEFLKQGEGEAETTLLAFRA